jgi:hypothetical protein
MANSPYLTDQAVLGSSPELIGLDRQRKIADLLTSQAFQSPQGQMISGHFVKPGWGQQLAPMLSAALGTNMNQNLDEKQGQLAAALRSQETASIEEYQKIKAEKGPAAANAYLAKQSSPTLRNAGLKELLAPPQTKEVAEGGKVFQQDADGNWKEVATGGAKFHAPISIDTGNSTILLDPITKQKIAEYPKAHQPVAGQVVETANGPMLINTRTGAATPIMGAGGQPLAPKLSAEQSKDITSINQQRATIEGALKSVEANPTAFTFSRGAAQNLPYGESLVGRMDKPENAAARAYVFNNVSAVIKERAGTAQSAQELQRINSFMPAVTDNAKQIENKLGGFKTYLRDLETGTRANPNVPMQGNMQAPSAGQGPRVVDFNSLPTGAR